MGDEVKHTAQKDGGKAEQVTRCSDSRSGYVRGRGYQLTEFEKPVGMGIDGKQVFHVAADVRPPADLMAPLHPCPIVDSFPDVNNVQARKRHIVWRSEEHTSELQSPCNLVCRLLLEKKKKKTLIDVHAHS